MNFLTILLAVLSRSASFRVGSKTVTIAQVPGAPKHFSFNLAQNAANLALTGAVGPQQVGSVQVTIQ